MLPPKAGPRVGAIATTKPAIPIYSPHSSLGITSTIKLNIIGVQRPTPRAEVKRPNNKI